MSEVAEQEPKLLTVKEAQPQARISRGLFYEGVRRGQIPSIRVGNRILIPRARFEAWLAGEEKAAA
jgi:excisionase family DNA binding protein